MKYYKGFDDTVYVADDTSEAEYKPARSVTKYGYMHGCAIGIHFSRVEITKEEFNTKVDEAILRRTEDFKRDIVGITNVFKDEMAKLIDIRQ